MMLCCCLFCIPVYADIPSIIIDGVVVESIPEESVVDKAVNFAMDIANDDSHGYSNAKECSGPGTYNCIGLVMRSYQAAGYDMGFCWIGKMPERLMSYGFVDVTDSVDLRTGAGAQKGDVFWMMHPGNEHGHTEILGDDNVLIGARGLGHNDKIPGDQDGSEISVIPYTNLGWQRVYRPPASLRSPAIVVEQIQDPIVIENVSTPIVVENVRHHYVMAERLEKNLVDCCHQWIRKFA
jgi:hypothetical protein